MTRQRGGHTSLVATLVLILAVGGCGFLQDSPDEESSPEQTTDDAGAADPSPSPAETEPPAPEQLPSVASARTSFSGRQLRLDILSIEVGEEALATLNLTITNESNGIFSAPDAWGSAVLESDFSGVYLIDEVNKQKYLPVLDEKDECVCSEFGLAIEPGETRVAFVTFAPPPGDVSTLTVVVPHFGPQRDIPVTR
ncbi:MAG: hypothetical protein ACRDJ5_07010 [Actinomycetota bacterium]